ncbi:MAG: Na+/H+ antiporter NhaC family protein [Bacteroidales bacterium]|nr:Na+/H+ antiporter NhaC family protein [Bacteroidales bacterium]MDZ4205053.1 Na+/H+ antiporter NhaC family protein [Bacteroidales bacterium]
MRKTLTNIFLTLFLSLAGLVATAQEPSSKARQEKEIEPAITIELPGIIVQRVEVNIQLVLSSEAINLSSYEPIEVFINGEKQLLAFKEGIASFPYTFKSREVLEVKIGEIKASRTVRPIPLWMSILPPLLAIAVALIFKEVISALFMGLLTGTFIIWYFRGVGVIAAIFNAIATIIDTYIPEAILDRGHISIIIFSMMIGAMVNLITRNGGMKGVVNQLSRFATSSRSGQIATWLMGIAIFFDDYANTLVVGNTMRPMTDRLRISREKLAYIVDSTAAPVAAVAFVTTWIGAQLSYISDGIRTLNLNESPYQVFIHSLQYAYYPFLTIGFVGILIYLGRDFGPMLKAERKARVAEHEEVKKNTFHTATSDNIPSRWYNAAIPVFVVVIGTITGLIGTGLEAVAWDQDQSFSYNLSHVIGQADTYRALLWSSLAATLVALVLTVSQRLIGLKESIESLIDGFRAMLTAIVILIMAWAIALITQHLHTADFISRLLLSWEVSPFMIPAITFLFAAGVSFSTGSSWGTMAILYPLILPATWLIGQAHGLDYDTSLSVFHNVVSCVLAGSVLGDHISPISDTTILSSLASSCNHIEHVRTQMPYALAVGVVAVVVGTIPAAYGIPGYILYPLSLLLLAGIIIVIGKKATQPT